MGIALGLGFCFALLLIEPASVGALISHTDQPRTTAVMLVSFFALLFGVGATMTGIIFTTMDRAMRSTATTSRPRDEAGSTTPDPVSFDQAAWCVNAGFPMIEIALSEVIRDFVERALLPLFGLSQPENPALESNAARSRQICS